MPNQYPLTPEKLVVTSDMLSDYAKGLMGDDANRNQFPMLIPNLMPKTKYIVHHRNLSEYLCLGMKLTKIHRAIYFNEHTRMKDYIDFNTQKRAAATTEFEKDFYKLLNNSVFGKTIEDVRRYKDIKLVFTQKRFLKLVSSPRLKSHCLFKDDFMAVEMQRATCCLDKPIYAGFSILDVSKLEMYRWHYDYILPKYGWENVKVLMTDTDSYIYLISQDGDKPMDCYKDMQEDSNLFDLRGCSQGSALYDPTNKKVLGKMKPETGERPISEVVCLMAKMYSVTMDDETEIKKAKGVSMSVVEKNIRFADYKLSAGGI